MPPTTAVEDVLLHLQQMPKLTGARGHHRRPSLSGARGHQLSQQIQIPTGGSWGVLQTEPLFLSHLVVTQLQCKDYVHQGLQAEVFVLDASAVIGSAGQAAPECARRCTMYPHGLAHNHDLPQEVAYRGEQYIPGG